MTFLDGSIPEVGGGTGNTLVGSVQEGSFSWADTLPGVFVEGEARRADKAFFSSGVPNSRGIARDTLVIGIKIRSSCGAFALEGLLVKD